MSVNHHLLAKTTTDSVLAKFKSGDWKCAGALGPGFYRVGCDSTFPSPDAVFYDDTEKVMVSFEFKPPTETKRGILTGLGQAIAYLNSSNISYLVIPQKLEDFDLGTYMTDLYKNQVNGRLPVGLIIYENDNPSQVSLVHNIDSITRGQHFTPSASGRFWAKHQDLPISLFHLILHFYYLKKVSHSKEDAFAECWNKALVPNSVLEKLTPVDIIDINGDVIKTIAGRKNISFFEKKIAAAEQLTGEDRQKEIQKLKKDSDTNFIGDNYYNSIKKNYVTFMKHIGTVDSTGNITDYGFRLYHLGLVNGPSSKTFKDYFTQAILIKGHHLDLIFDLDKLCNEHRGQKTKSEIIELMAKDYEARGMIKRNPNRISGASNSVDFLKYEFILWRSLDLFVDTTGLPELSFNWKRITEICSLPDLSL